MLMLVRNAVRIALKSHQLPLFDMPVHVAESVDKHGRARAAHMSTRKKRIEHSPQPAVDAQSKLDGWIATHGGTEHMRVTVDSMTPEQRAKLIDAMAHVGEISHEAVMAKLGIREPEAPVPQQDQQADVSVPGVIDQNQVSIAEDREDLADEIARYPHREPFADPVPEPPAAQENWDIGDPRIDQLRSKVVELGGPDAIGRAFSARPAEARFLVEKLAEMFGFSSEQILTIIGLTPASDP